jgi:DNA/RNA endonuclease YhcR with UshA esterase domain
MQEKHIKRIAFILTLLGLSILYIYAQEADLKPSLESLNQLPSSKITLQGKITTLEHTDKVTFITLEAQRQEITLVLIFNPESLYLKQGNVIQVQGTIEEYNGKKEIIADKITLLSS